MDAGQKYFRNYKLEQSLTQRRIVFAAIFVMVLITVLIGRLFYLQVVEFERYQTKADQNRLKLVTEPPSRGLIYDRNGLVLADNRPIHSLTIVPERVKDMDAFREIIEIETGRFEFSVTEEEFPEVIKVNSNKNFLLNTLASLDAEKAEKMGTRDLSKEEIAL
ncbi:MAG: hypothetical protein ACPGUE_07825 [Marinomonas sp.]